MGLGRVGQGIVEELLSMHRAPSPPAFLAASGGRSSEGAASEVPGSQKGPSEGDAAPSPHLQPERAGPVMLGPGPLGRFGGRPRPWCYKGSCSPTVAARDDGSCSPGLAWGGGPRRRNDARGRGLFACSRTEIRRRGQRVDPCPGKGLGWMISNYLSGDRFGKLKWDWFREGTPPGDPKGSHLV